jgi:hypothetical protein
MKWNYNEIVRSGNSTARIKNFYPDTGLVVLYDIKGYFEVGSTIVGDESGETLTFNEFTLSRSYDLFFDPTYWENVLENAIYIDNGEIVALDAHFTGKLNQDYQVTYLIVVG